MRYLFLLVLMINLSCSDERQSEIINDFNNENNQWLVDESLVKEGAPFEFIDSPKFKKPSEFDTISDDELVLMFSHKGKIRVFPYIYLNYSEVVNDELEGLKYVASYCPQTKSGICFQKNINGKEFNMFASGYLYKDNLVLTSKEDNKTFWSQMMLTGIKGREEFLGIRTELAIETKWKIVKSFFKNADVYYHDLLGKNRRNVIENINFNGKVASGKYFGILSKGFDNFDKRATIYSYNSFINQKLKRLVVNGRRSLVYGNTDKNVFIAFYELNDRELYEVNEKEFPIILKDNFGNRWNIFGEVISGPKKGDRLASPSFYHAELWAWNCFFKDEVTLNPQGIKS